MAAKITKDDVKFLTSAQASKYYQEYLRSKTKVAGDPLDMAEWRNTIEEYLNRHAKFTGKTFSAESIKEANKKIVASGHFSTKQKTALRESYARGVAGLGEKGENQFWADFRRDNPAIVPEKFGQNWGVIWAYLRDYSGDWREYFNS